MSNEFYNVMPTKQYASTLDVLSQEHSKLFGRVWNKGTLTGEEAYFNQLDPFDMSFNRSRYAETSFTEPTYQRRRITKTPANVAVPLDDLDLVETLVDPKSELSQNGMYAAGRAKDKIIWNAIYSTAQTGKAGGTSTAFDTSQIVDVQTGGDSSDVGLNLEKILGAVEIIMGNSVDLENPMNKLCMVISPKQWNDYLQIAKLTSDDYMSKSLNSGRLAIPGVPNGEVIVSNMVPYMNTAETSANVDLEGADVAWNDGGAAIDVDTTSHRAVTMFAMSGIGFGTWQETQVKAQERPDLNNIWQLWMQIQCGASRLEEGKAVAIECQE